ncbi:FAD-dependent oxidoreductase [Catellatospora sp. KI3]|uniref:NAD(P)/FAD-dependent oxidoreductase n=1 Tax=Catellatospora sp. KI3 TaxID=3041620 RepID=UPI002482351B|nr:FAD-dependent oxidoreductase [Catellatospora sp. KI3]MDI1464654.1 FAD-dependent oxidoreductase [Catellatospora sp. KI3]
MGRPRVVIVGAGFAGFHTARKLHRLARDRAEIILVNPDDYLLYLPLLPQVMAGVLEPRRITVSLAATLPGVRVLPGTVDDVDLGGGTVSYTEPHGRAARLDYDRLVLTPGSVNRLLPIPGVAQHAHGLRGLAEALYLRDHITLQIELAAATADAHERRARATFVVVGAGYTGTEAAAYGQLLTDALARTQPALRERPRWLLLDTAERVLPDLAPKLSRIAARVLAQRGVEVLTGTSVAEATADGVHLTDGAFVATRSLIWCVGVRPDPLVEGLGLDAVDGRLVVDEYLRVPGHPEVLACGDAAGVPDFTRPGRLCPMTAQHAVRQGRLAAHNIAASYGSGRLKPYRHKDLGFLVDLGMTDAAADPLGIPLSGLPAAAVTRGYHLLALPGNRVRVAADWLLGAFLRPQLTRLGLVDAAATELECTSAGQRPRAGARASARAIAADPGPW